MADIISVAGIASNLLFCVILLVFVLLRFYARQLYRQVLLRARISYGNSVRLSLCLPRPGTNSRPGEIQTSRYHHIKCLVSYEVIWCCWVRKLPSNEGIKEGYPHLEIIILPLLARLAWKRLQIDTDLRLIITSTVDELSGGTSIDDREPSWTPKIAFFSEFLAILGCDTHFKSKLHRNHSR